ncbi:hypothetical protein F4820DRAFT_328040 [Hypoxylon rubiginosum]|uniref:Uncharacterized protein n=1 Tax=Hypoxylon rubiginosum TaxID=110542 RepID=A0ACB9YYS2_9PEZI|nr:hypothetical protein F4820DRAFT_328040 [Hypoxylon rubiginosum]
MTMESAGSWPKVPGGAMVVGVTAFGLYAETHDFNASMEVLDALPDILYSNSTPPRTIHLVKYPHIRVTYDEVTKAVRDIWNASSASWAETIAATGVEFGEKDCLKVNFVLHLGQMRSYPGYSLEKLGNRDGYVRRDLDGKIPQTIATSSETPTELQFASCPPILYPDFDVEDLAMRLKSAMPNTLIRASTAAGRFSCEYMFYSSLAELWKRGLEKKVMFLHVPARNSNEDINTGVEVVKNLVLEISDTPI